jgi:hypothetical protein
LIFIFSPRKARSGSRTTYSSDEEEEEVVIPPISPSKSENLILRPSPSLESMLGHLNIQENDDYSK